MLKRIFKNWSEITKSLVLQYKLCKLLIVVLVSQKNRSAAMQTQFSAVNCDIPLQRGNALPLLPRIFTTQKCVILIFNPLVPSVYKKGQI